MKPLVVSIAICLVYQLLVSTNSHAQTGQPTVTVPPGGVVNMKDLPRLGEEVHGALQTARVGTNPLQPMIGNSLQCRVDGLWECRTWLYADGRGVHFYARRGPDGALQISSTEFRYRWAGLPGNYQFCRTPLGSSAEHCTTARFLEGRFLYDEWFNTYDRPAEGRFPAYRSVHEHHALIPGRR